MKKILLALTLLLHLSVMCQDSYQPTKENLKNREEFQNNKFGIFIHWGIYSMLADGEWVMHYKNIDHKEYRKLAGSFYPTQFDAHKWISAIKGSGAKYICFTARHHDGFSMFKTKQSDYNIVDASPFKRDIVKELADACTENDIKLHLYYSHLDWDRSDYPIGKTGKKTGRTGDANWESYYQFMNNQLTELLTEYGDIRAIWFDGWWDQMEKEPPFNWQLTEQYNLIHQLQPACLIGNNHHQSPFMGEDFQTFERDLPGQNKSGYSSGKSISKLPLESCETMNKTWGYSITDNKYKTTKQLIHLLVRAAGNNANLLLNIGPQPDGQLPESSLEKLQEIGEWLDIYGETIYNSRSGIVAERDWGVSTQNGDKIYIHILDLKDKGLFIPITNVTITKVVSFTDKKTIPFKKTKDGILLQLHEVPQEIDFVVEITIKS